MRFTCFMCFMCASWKCRGVGRVGRSLATAAGDSWQVRSSACRPAAVLAACYTSERFLSAALPRVAAWPVACPSRACRRAGCGSLFLWCRACPGQTPWVSLSMDAAALCPAALPHRGEWPDWLAVSSDKGTVHVFSLRRGMGQSAGRSGEGSGSEGTSPSRTNPTSALSFVSVSTRALVPQ